MTLVLFLLTVLAIVCLGRHSIRDEDALDNTDEDYEKNWDLYGGD